MKFLRQFLFYENSPICICTNLVFFCFNSNSVLVTVMKASQKSIQAVYKFQIRLYCRCQSIANKLTSNRVYTNYLEWWQHKAQFQVPVEGIIEVWPHKRIHSMHTFTHKKQKWEISFSQGYPEEYSHLPGLHKRSRKDISSRQKPPLTKWGGEAHSVPVSLLRWHPDLRGGLQLTVLLLQEDRSKAVFGKDPVL